MAHGVETGKITTNIAARLDRLHFLLANNCKRGKKCPHGRHPDKATLKNARARGETRDLELQVISITALDTLKPFGRKMEAQLSVYTAL